jgi:adenylate cyclase class 2
MNEIEVKILGIDKKEIIAKLQKLGARKVFEGEIAGIAFETKDNRMQKKHNLLRLRKEGRESVLGFKGKKKKSKFKIREEIEVKVDDFNAMKEILLRLGFFPKHQSIKYRVSYMLSKAIVEIDTYRNLSIPAFLEIESSSKKEIERAVNLLGYSMTDTNSWSLPEVIKYYARKK